MFVSNLDCESGFSSKESSIRCQDPGLGKSKSQVLYAKMFPHSRKEIVSFLYGALLVCILIFSLLQFERFRSFVVDAIAGDNVGGGSIVGDKSIAIPMEQFPEPAWRTANTISARTVASTKFSRFEIHKVRTESGEIVDDWLWTDERSHINVLVHLKAEDKYMLFRQKKYGLERDYYATVGGLFDPGDTPEGCARRELREETGLEAGSLVSLGRYRVQVNRGGGTLYAFLAKDCVPAGEREEGHDYERQEVHKLSREELIRVALAGEIGEAQWAAAVALGILHEEHSSDLSTK